MVDCDKGDYGCDGGWPATVLDYMATTGTVESSFYTPPYTAVQNITCPVPSNQTRIKCPVASEEISSTTAGNCNRLKALLTKGPVYIGFYAATDFSTYKSGVYTPTNTNTCPAGYKLIFYFFNTEDIQQYRQSSFTFQIDPQITP